MSAVAPQPVTRRRLRIGELLVTHKVISEAQLAAALAEQRRSGRKIGRVLVEQGVLTEDGLVQALARHLNLPYVDLKRHDFKPELVRLLPETHARRFRVIVLADRGADLLVGMADPTDIFAYDKLAALLSRPFALALVHEADLLRAIDAVYRRTEEISSLAGELGQELRKSDSDYDTALLESGADASEAPVMRLIKSLFEDAVQVKASDIHIEPDETLLRMRQRVDGVLQEQILPDRRIAPALATRLKLMAGLDIAEKRLPQDGRFSIKAQGVTLDVRMSTMPAQHGESIVMRLLSQSAGFLALTQLGMPEGLRLRFEHLIRRPHGMILITGPTGSGKTTTLYAALSELNQSDVKIITVEDPVEYRLPRITQVQVNEKIALDFATVLRSALRQDPDILLVGEIRDQETAHIGVRASLTGHLVLSTLHTNNAIATATRLVDMGVAGYLVASSLRAVVAQRLVRRVCPVCAVPRPPDAPQRAWLHALLGEAADLAGIRAGKGCTYCNHSGYQGRVGVYELLEMDEAMVNALRHEDTAAFARAARASPHFRPLTRAALDYVLAGVTTLDEAQHLAGELEEDWAASGRPA